jgi:hypothetical protein
VSLGVRSTRGCFFLALRTRLYGCGMLISVQRYVVVHADRMFDIAFSVSSILLDLHYRRILSTHRRGAGNT